MAQHPNKMKAWTEYRTPRSQEDALMDALMEIAKIGREDYGPAAASRMAFVANVAIRQSEKERN